MKNSELQNLAQALNSLTAEQIIGAAPRLAIARNMRAIKEEMETLNEVRAKLLSDNKCVPTPTGQNVETVTRDQEGGAAFIAAWAAVMNAETPVAEKLVKIKESDLNLEAMSPALIAELLPLIS